MGPWDAVGGAERPAPRQAALDLAIVCGATALLLLIFPATHAVHLDPLRRFLVPARLALLVLLASTVLWRKGGTWRGLGLRRPSKLWRAGLVALVGYVLGEISGGLTAQFVLPALGLPAPAVPPFLASVRGDLAEYLYWMIPVTWGSAAFGEELLFRGFILDRLNALFGGRAIWLAVVLQALLFGVAHGSLGPSGAVVAGVLGLVLGIAFVAAGRNLWPCFLIHGLVDSTSMTAVFLGAVHH